MTLTEIDQALEDWQAKIAAATENLLMLEDLPVVHRLQPQSGDKPPLLTGLTASKVQPALALLPQLFQSISLMTEVIDRAAALRRPLTVFWRPERTLNQIEELLLGPSITFPSEQTPFARRSLLSASEQVPAITLSTLLARMSQSFEDAKTILLETETAWARGETALLAVRDKVDVLDQMAAALGETDAPDLVTIRAQLKQWTLLFATDPLGLEAGWDGAAALRQAHERLEKIGGMRDRAETLRNEASAVMTEWDKIAGKAESARAECARRIAGSLPRRIDRLPEMQRWLTTLEEACARRHWQAAEIGLGHWLQAGRTGLEEEKQAARTCASWLESSYELPGRLSALRAKAAAHALESNPDLSRLGQEADRILSQKPLTLVQAETAVSAYMDRLNALLKKS
ncbi:MAG: hypothetical protein ACRYFS_21110 [Janthinobacterium lividum]